jgi:hypothetical protein
MQPATLEFPRKIETGVSWVRFRKDGTFLAIKKVAPLGFPRLNMLNWLSCYLSGRHDYGIACEPGSIFLRCVHCGKRSNGWAVNETTLVTPPRTSERQTGRQVASTLPFPGRETVRQQRSA